MRRCGTGSPTSARPSTSSGRWWGPTPIRRWCAISSPSSAGRYGRRSPRRSRLPDYLVACVGGGSNAMGLFFPFKDDVDVKMVGVEAGGLGVATGRHAATLVAGTPGVLHGAFSYLLQDGAGQVSPTHSVSAGLDYPGVGPEHSYFKDTGRAQYVAVSDQDALQGFRLLAQTEGIIPALEPAHAIAYLRTLVPTLSRDHAVVVALSGRVTLRSVLDLVGRARPAVPVVLLSYYNPIIQFGVERFCVDAALAGVDGVVIPDLPADEADELVASARPAGLDTIFLLAPTSTDARIRVTAGRSSGFIYGVSVTGVTGVRDRLPEDIPELIGRIKKWTRLPVCVGFGVSTPEQARRVAEVADGVIVGSALVSMLEQPGDQVVRLDQFVRELREAIDAVGARGSGEGPRGPNHTPLSRWERGRGEGSS